MQRRLSELGIYSGSRLEVVRNSGGPVIVLVLGTRFAIGRGQASKIEVRQ